MVIKGSLYYKIKNLTTAKHAWDKIQEVCRPKGFSYLFVAFKKFDDLKASNFRSVEDYGTKFWETIDELSLFPGSPRMDPNWLIFKYLSGLGDSARSFTDGLVLKHEPFTTVIDNGESRTVPNDQLSTVIHNYEEYCGNHLRHH